MQPINRLGLLSVAVTAFISLIGFTSYRELHRAGYISIPSLAFSPTTPATLPDFDLKTADSELGSLKDQISEDFSLLKGSPNPSAQYTALYTRALPAGLPETEAFAPERLAVFAQEHAGPLLPTSPAQVLGTTTTDANSLQSYRERLQPVPGGSFYIVGSSDVLSLAELDPKSDQFKETLDHFEQNLTRLQIRTVPSGVIDVHTNYVNVLAAVVENAQLRLTLAQDPVGAFIAQYKLKQLAPLMEKTWHDLKRIQTENLATLQVRASTVTASPEPDQSCQFCLDLNEVWQNVPTLTPAP
jgi:hypothetical protein